MDAEKTFRTLVERLPAIVFIESYGDGRSPQYISPRINDLLGYTPEEWVAEKNLWEKSLHPEDRERTLAEDSRADRTGDPFLSEYRLRARNGRYVWVKEETYLIRDEDGTPLFWQGILIDITKQKQAQEALLIRDEIIEAVSYTAEQLLKAPNWRDCILQALERLGKTAYASRVYVYKRSLSNDDKILFSQTFRWRDAEDISRFSIPQETKPEWVVFPRWIQLFDDGLPVHGIVSEFPSDERDELNRNGVLSIVCLPILVNNGWWGILSFEDCRMEREWSIAVIETMRAAASALGAAIQRELSAEAILQSETSYQGLFNSVNDAIFIQDADGRFLDVNNGAFRMYGYPKEFFIGKSPEILGAAGRNDPAEIMKSIQRAFNGEPQRFEFWGLRKNGETFPEDVHLYKGVYFGKDAVIAVAQDITERKRSEDALQRQLKELTVLHAVALAGSSSLNTDELLQRVTDIIGDSLYTDNCGILLLDSSGETLQPHFSYRGVKPEQLNLILPIAKGISGKVARLREPVRSGDVTKEADYFEVLNDVRSELCVPISSGGKFFGVLNAESKQLNAFADADERLLNTIAGGLATAIEKLQLFETEQRRRQESENLRVAATAITSTLEPKQVLDTILIALQEVIPYDSASIFRLEGESVRLTAAKGLPQNDLVINHIYPADNPLLEEIKRTGQPFIIDDCAKDSRFEKWAVAANVHGWLGAPLIARSQVVGFITMDSVTAGAFNDNDATLAQIFAHQAAAAIENARLFTETRQRLEELEVVSRISFSLRAARVSEQMLPILINEIRRSMETDSVSIWLFNPESDELIQKAASGRLSNLPIPNFKPNEGIVGFVFTTGQFHASSSFALDPKTLQGNLGALGNDWGGISVPIRTSSETIGVMTVAFPNTRIIESHHIQLMTTIAEIAGNAIHRSDLFQRNEEQIQRLVALREVDSAISSSIDLRVTLDILSEHLLTKIGASAAAILKLNPNNQTLNYVSARGFNNKDILRKSLFAGEGLAGRVILDQNDLYIENLDQQAKSIQQTIIAREGFVSYFGVPLQSKGLTRGVLEIYFRSHFTPNADWLDFLHTLAGQATIAMDNAELFENLQRSNQELSLAYDTTLEGWGKALELRDKETEGHTRRVTELTVKLARKMGIPDSELTHIRRGVLLHDIGKMGVPDNILRKEGPLNDEEWVEMRKHPQYAYDLIYPIPYLRASLDIPYAHHEWWNGKGYPLGLKNEKIPLSARIFAVVDVWDALLSDRPYRKAWPKAKVIKYLRDLSGVQFDPNVVKTFLRMMERKT